MRWQRSYLDTGKIKKFGYRLENSLIGSELSRNRKHLIWVKKVQFLIRNCDVLVEKRENYYKSLIYLQDNFISKI